MQCIYSIISFFPLESNAIQLWNRNTSINIVELKNESTKKHNLSADFQVYKRHFISSDQSVDNIIKKYIFIHFFFSLCKHLIICHISSCYESCNNYRHSENHNNWRESQLQPQYATKAGTKETKELEKGFVAVVHSFSHLSGAFFTIFPIMMRACRSVALAEQLGLASLPENSASQRAQAFPAVAFMIKLQLASTANASCLYTAHCCNITV